VFVSLLQKRVSAMETRAMVAGMKVSAIGGDRTTASGEISMRPAAVPIGKKSSKSGPPLPRK
jgi:hypothetical protein